MKAHLVHPRVKVKPTTIGWLGTLFFSVRRTSAFKANDSCQCVCHDELLPLEEIVCGTTRTTRNTRATDSREFRVRGEDQNEGAGGMPYKEGCQKANREVLSA